MCDKAGKSNHIFQIDKIWGINFKILEKICLDFQYIKVPCVMTAFLPQEGDRFTRTECYHYFHINCFACYVHHLEKVDDNVDGIPWQPQMLHAQSNVRCNSE